MENLKFKKDLRKILWRLQDMLENAPAEEECTKEENDVFADMENLVESINILLG